MKKAIRILTVILLVLLMAIPVFASGGDDDGPLHDINDDKGGNSGYDSLEDLRERLGNSLDDSDLRHELMKQIVELKKQIGDNSISVFIDGQDVKFDVPPVIRSSRTLIPVRAVTTALGAQVDWSTSDPDIVKITKVVKDNTGNEVLRVIVINLDTEKVTVNGVKTSLDVPPMLIGNRTMVPIRFVAEAFNMDIDWDNYVGGIVVDTDDNSNRQ